MAVQVIKARAPRQEAAKQKEKLKVAAYCRVSTDSDEQEGSYTVQCEHYTEYIRQNPDWELAGIYADEGISGTQAKKRPEFLRMIEDCKAGKIDLVITKSISRWARNTLDSLQYIRELKAIGIGVYFEKENIHTLDAKGEVLITIMSSIAQQESQSISQNVRLGIQYRMQQGKGRLNTAYFLGYTKDPDSDGLIIVPEEAEIVRRIFREYLEGFSPAQICRHLEADGVKTGTGGAAWYTSTITSMLENEKYAGDLLLQKYYTVDVLTHEIAKNTGQFPQYYVEDDHDPIVPKEVYFQVQGEMMRRSAYKMDPVKFKMGSEKGLKNRVVCGKCGRFLRWYESKQDWRCRKRNRAKYDGELNEKCDLRDVTDREIRSAILAAFQSLPKMRDDLIRRQAELRSGEIRRIGALIDESKTLEGKLEERRITIAASEGHEDELTFLDERISDEEEKRRSLILERAEHVSNAMKVTLLLELTDALMHKDTWEKEERPAACHELSDFMERTRYAIPEETFDESGEIAFIGDELIARFVEEIAAFDDRIEVRFKGGITCEYKD